MGKSIRVSIIIPTRDNIQMLRDCLESIKSRTTFQDYEVLVVDNQSRTPEMRHFLSSLSCRVIPYDKPFNFSKLNNLASSLADGEHLIFLNDDTSVISSDWIGQMLAYSERPDVGAVGAKLLLKNNTIQHAGILIGVGGITSHAFAGFSSNDGAYDNLIQTPHECSAVTAACMMIEKSKFTEVGGFDENLAFSYNDVDLCLRLRRRGYKNIYAPGAELYHFTTSTRTYVNSPEELRYFVKRWSDLIVRGDPYYDAALSRRRPYRARKAGEERFVLQGTILLPASQSLISRMFEIYVGGAALIIRQSGPRRLIAEFLVLLRTKISRLMT